MNSRLNFVQAFNELHERRALAPTNPLQIWREAPQMWSIRHGPPSVNVKIGFVKIGVSQLTTPRTHDLFQESGGLSI